MVGLKAHPTNGVQVTLRYHVSRGFAVVTSGLLTALRYMTFLSAPSTGLQLAWLRYENDFADDPN